MLFRSEALAGIRAGTVTLAYRWWRQPRVRPGTRLRTAAGVVEVGAVEAVDPAAVPDVDARRAGYASAADLLADAPGRDRSAGPDGDRRLFRVTLAFAGADPRAALRADASPAAVADLVATLRRLDGTGRRGPWTGAILALIAARPGVRAHDLAPRLGYADPLAFKRDVRRLKELGLTESLPVGYRLSPRGEAVLAHLGIGPAGDP
jgi:hypothetical protein